MGIIQDLPNDIKFKHVDKRITNAPGLLPLVGLLRRHHILSYFQRHLREFDSNHAYDGELYPFTQMANRWSGGMCIEDGRWLAEDRGLHDLLDVRGLTFPNTQSPYFNSASFREAHRVRAKNRQVAWTILKRMKATRLHIDIDAKVHASQNQNAESTYKGYTGYHPLYVTVPNHKVCLDALFRSGSASARSHLGSAVRTIIKEMPARIREVFFTLDSAGWQKAVIKAIHQAGHLFYIKVPEDPHGNKEDLIRSIQKGAWEPVASPPGEKPEDWNSRRDGREIAETEVPIGTGENKRTFRMVVVRKPKESLAEVQMQAFEEMENPPYGMYQYERIGTNDQKISLSQVYHTYNRRGEGEDVIGEVVEDGEGDRFPFKKDAGNALYLGLNVLTYNLMAEAEQEAGKEAESLRSEADSSEKEKDSIPPLENWGRLVPASFRKRVVNVATLITEHARDRIIQISKDHPWGTLFERLIFACWNPAKISNPRGSPAPI